MMNYKDESFMSKEEIRAKNEYKRKFALELGVNILLFDDGVEDSLFKNTEEKAQYNADCMKLSAFLDSGEPIPQDLILRLLTIKKRRENLVKKKK